MDPEVREMFLESAKKYNWPLPSSLKKPSKQQTVSTSPHAPGPYLLPHSSSSPPLMQPSTILRPRLMNSIPTSSFATPHPVSEHNNFAPDTSDNLDDLPMPSRFGPIPMTSNQDENNPNMGPNTYSNLFHSNRHGHIDKQPSGFSTIKPSKYSMQTLPDTVEINKSHNIENELRLLQLNRQTHRDKSGSIESFANVFKPSQTPADTAQNVQNVQKQQKTRQEERSQTKQTALKVSGNIKGAADASDVLQEQSRRYRSRFLDSDSDFSDESEITESPDESSESSQKDATNLDALGSDMELEPNAVNLKDAGQKHQYQEQLRQQPAELNSVSEPKTNTKNAKNTVKNEFGVHGDQFQKGSDFDSEATETESDELGLDFLLKVKTSQHSQSKKSSAARDESDAERKETLQRNDTNFDKIDKNNKNKQSSGDKMEFRDQTTRGGMSGSRVFSGSEANFGRHGRYGGMQKRLSQICEESRQNGNGSSIDFDAIKNGKNLQQSDRSLSPFVDTSNDSHQSSSVLSNHNFTLLKYPTSAKTKKRREPKQNNLDSRRKNGNFAGRMESEAKGVERNDQNSRNKQKNEDILDDADILMTSSKMNENNQNVGKKLDQGKKRTRISIVDLDDSDSDSSSFSSFAIDTDLKLSNKKKKIGVKGRGRKRKNLSILDLSSDSSSDELLPKSNKLTKNNGKHPKNSLQIAGFASKSSHTSSSTSAVRGVTTKRKKVRHTADHLGSKSKAPAAATHDMNIPRSGNEHILLDTKGDANAAASKTFKKRRDAYVTYFFDKINECCFDNFLKRNLDPSKGSSDTCTVSNVSVVWSNKLNKTAGLCSNMMQNKQRKSVIKLASKVLTDAERLKQTLCHEMCHAMQYLSHGTSKPPHGPQFQFWARKCENYFYDIKVTTCHSYKIEYKYQWQCSNKECNYKYGRHSKSISVEKHRCGLCKSALVFLGTLRHDGTLNKPRKDGKNGGSEKTKLNPYAEFVKKYYAEIKKEYPAAKHGDLMRILSKKYKLSKQEVKVK